MKKFLMIILVIFGLPTWLGAANGQEYLQKDRLFKIHLPDGWRANEIPGKVILLPSSGGEGIVIQFKAYTGSENPEDMKASILAHVERIIEIVLVPIGGQVIENRELTLDHVNARGLFYSISLKGTLVYFIRIVLIHKGYTFNIDYGSPAKEEVEKIINLVDTFKF